MLTIRRETVTFGIRKRKKEREQEIQLQIEITEIEKKLDELGTQEISQKLHRKKEELEEIREKRLRGSLVRSRAIWRGNAEKPSKYFLTLEKRGYESKMIPCIRSEGGVKRSQIEILKSFEEFFGKRLSRQNNATEEINDEYLKELEANGITSMDRMTLEEPISLAELGLTLARMRNGVSPGSDGFSVEFFKFFLV